MDSFMTKLFEEPQCSPELLGEDPWVFSCKCHKYCSSQNPDAEVEVHLHVWQSVERLVITSKRRCVLQEQWFECSKCKIWAHVRCIHPDLAGKAAEDLLSRCFATDASLKPPVSNLAVYQAVDLEKGAEQHQRAECAAV